MTIPSLGTYANGVNVVSGDQLNTFVQSCTNAATLRTFVGLTGMTVSLQGTASVGDGTAGLFRWNATSIAPDDGINVIVPPAAAAGAWNRLSTSSTSTGGTITGNPSQPGVPLGQVSSANSTLLINSTTALTTTAEFGLGVNLTSATGKGASVPLSGNKVAGYFAASATTNSGNVWAINSLLLLNAGACTQGGAQIAEFDLANNSGTHFGDATDTTTIAQPALFGVQITGVSTNRATAALAILGNITGSAPMWNNGVVAANTSLRQRFLWDLTNCTTSYDITGSHTYGIDFRGSSTVGQSSYSAAAIRFGSQNVISWRNQADAVDVALVQTDSSNNFLIGNPSAPILAVNSPALAIASVSGPTITTGAGVPSSTQPSGSIYLRTAGSGGARFYVTSGSGVWAAVATV